MSEVLVPQIEGGAELRELLRTVVRVRTQTLQLVQETIQRVVQFGRRLLEVKEKITEHGEFRAWLAAEEIVGDREDQISFETARRWMVLARFDEKHGAALDGAASVTQAYRIAGLLPDPEASARKGGTNPLQAVQRLEEHIRSTPIEKLNRAELEQLKATLARLRELEAEVERRLGGTPPIKESLYQGGIEPSKRLPELSYE